MKIERLSAFDDNAVLAADLVIVGGGPAGLTLAAQCAAPGRRILIVESGLELEDPDHSALNRVEIVNEPRWQSQALKRDEFHAGQAPFWSHAEQPYGVRCRALGGSTHAWAGKSAPFDAIDFEARPWVPDSGWPIGHAEFEPYLLRAMEVLNLCPSEPPVRFGEDGLRSYYWQFARSRVDRLDVMRFGRETLAQDRNDTRVLLDATVTHIGLNADGSQFSHLEVASLEGRRARIEAKFCVLAASAIENARLLLASNDVHAAGIGNAHDSVGRYLMDHAGARVGSFPPEAIARLARLFGFFGIRHRGRAHMFMHGLALTPELQERGRLLNASVYFATQRAPDDPWDALKRLLRWRSASTGADLRSVLAGSGLIAKGLGMRILNDDRIPRGLKDLIVNTAIRLSPNMVADEFQSHGVPHKITDLTIEAISEQAPNRDSRIMLSSQTDRFGVPLARIDWRIEDAERRTLLAIARQVRDAFARAGLPAPELEDWVDADRPQDIVVIDMAHTLGTTRMSSGPKTGAVDGDCRVHGVHNLFVAGGSAFPTSGHANPTLMILALTMRLADRLNLELASPSGD